jgi:hypothetical protein
LEVMEKYKTLQKYHMYFLISYFCAFWQKKYEKNVLHEHVAILHTHNIPYLS